MAKGSSRCVVRSTFLLVGKGLDIAQLCSFSFYEPCIASLLKKTIFYDTHFKTVIRNRLRISCGSNLANNKSYTTVIKNYSRN